MVRIAINGFGRIGRMVFKAASQQKGIDVVAINDLADPLLLAHLLKYDSVQPPFFTSVKATQKSITVNGKKVAFFQEKDPQALPWKELKVDVVCESTGFFRTKEKASLHLNAGAKKVLISAPAKESSVRTIINGVNEKQLKKTDRIVSNGSCTTNSLALMVKVLQDAFGFEKGFFRTVHAYTSTQNLIDGPSKDWRRARAAAINMIPTSTGAASTVGEVIPVVRGKLDGIAIRVPVPNGSLTDLTCTVKKAVSVEAVNTAFKKAAQGKMKHVLSYGEDPIVSTDIVGKTCSTLFDSPLTKVNGKLVQVYGWYDNEWGFSHRMVDLMKLMR